LPPNEPPLMPVGRHGAAGTNAPSRPVLCIGTAQSVLIEHVPADPGVRIAVAEARLRQTSGRADIVVDRRPSGRPRLNPPYPELGVSLSHRSDLLLAAFSTDTHVGTDVEVEAPDLEAARLAADHFSPGEASAVARMTAVSARDLVMRLWVAKEAALKLTGRGVFDGMTEPDLAGSIDALLIDSKPFSVAARERLPALRLAVRRLVVTDGRRVYCALAAAGTGGEPR
jgi:4'-phosphopantetheinyl transferase